MQRESDVSSAATARMPLKDAKEAFERRYLEELMSRHKGDIKAAAEHADLHPKSLARLLRRYAIGRGQ